MTGKVRLCFLTGFRRSNSIDRWNDEGGMLVCKNTSVQGMTMKRKGGWVYILASKRNGTLYIGVTSNLQERIWAHKQKAVPGFTKTYNITMLVYVERFETIDAAITREKQLKTWKRSWKIELIEKDNPEWRDLYEDGAIHWETL